MDPITLISLLYKITIFSPIINTNSYENKIIRHEKIKKYHDSRGIIDTINQIIK